MKRWKGKKQKAVYDENGRRLATNESEDTEGVPMSDWWEISIINPAAKERLGYPTQKPLALLERIIEASSESGDTVLDPFCGCGTAVHAAQKLNRKWIGIDITHLAISLIEKRMKDAFPEITFKVHGAPQDFDGAVDLAKRDKYQFQWWACSLVNAQPFQGKRKGKDVGIDGLIFPLEAEGEPAKKIIVQVKGGHVKAGDIRDLRGVIEREEAIIGLFVTLEKPTKDMNVEAANAGFYETGAARYKRIQILTIKDLLDKKESPEYFDLHEIKGSGGFKKTKQETRTKRSKDLFSWKEPQAAEDAMEIQD